MDRIVDQCRAVLGKHYGPQFAGLVLYGSTARGEETETSDVDLLVLLRQPFDFFAELRRIVELLYPLQLESERYISARPADIAAFEEGKVQLYRNARREGVLV